ncbi:MAG: 2'-5' RNA ligase family protein [Segetibacter sp.]
MKYLIGVVPETDLYNTVLNIQKKFGDNRLEPHITIRPPVTVADETQWINAIEMACTDFSPIQIQLPATGNFGKRVLFIDVFSKELSDLHYKLLKAVKPFEQPEVNEKDNQSYHPHLTLGRSWCGFTKEDFAQMKTLADNFLSQRPASFIARSIRIYHKPPGNKRYETLKDILLDK